MDTLDSNVVSGILAVISIGLMFILWLSVHVMNTQDSRLRNKDTTIDYLKEVIAEKQEEIDKCRRGECKL